MNTYLGGLCDIIHSTFGRRYLQLIFADLWTLIYARFVESFAGLFTTDAGVIANPTYVTPETWKLNGLPMGFT